MTLTMPSTTNMNNVVTVAALSSEGLVTLLDSGIFGHRTSTVLVTPEQKELCAAWDPSTVQFDAQGHVVTLDLSSCRLRKGLAATMRPTGVVVSSVFRNKFSYLVTLNLGGTDLPVADILELGSAVSSTLESLFLGGNSLGDVGAAAIGTWLPTARHLTKLDLRYNDIGPVGCQALCQGLSIQRTVVQLYLEGNTLGNDGATALANLLIGSPEQENQDNNNSKTCYETPPSSCPIEELFLGGNHIGAEGGTALASVLASNQTLRKLYLEGNNIGVVGAMAFTTALTNCQGTTTGLKHLFCDNNNIGKEGSQQLARALNSATAILGDSLLEA
jgi:Leucine Rich repeat